MNERCRHHTLTTAFCKRPAGHEGCCVFTDSERTYTYAEMLANQAAALRAAADILQFHFNQSTIDTGRIPLALAKKAILALTTDQSALDRRDAKIKTQWEESVLKVVSNALIESLQEEINKMREAISPGRQNVGCDYYCAVARRLRDKDTQIHLKGSDAVRSFANKIHWLSQTHGVERIDELIAAHDAELKAQFAAVMEKAADDLLIAIESEDSPVENAEYEHRFIMSRIPTDYAAALAERVQSAELTELEAILSKWKDIQTFETADFTIWLCDRIATHRAAAGAPFTKAVQDKPEEKK